MRRRSAARDSYKSQAVIAAHGGVTCTVRAGASRQSVMPGAGMM